MTDQARIEQLEADFKRLEKALRSLANVINRSARSAGMASATSTATADAIQQTLLQAAKEISANLAYKKHA